MLSERSGRRGATGRRDRVDRGGEVGEAERGAQRVCRGRGPGRRRELPGNRMPVTMTVTVITWLGTLS